MSPDLANLLGALRAQPNDEVAYLALADWCLEQPDQDTQARGEHVRASLALSKLARNDPSGRHLRDRVKALEKRHRAAWLGPLRDFAHRCDFLPGGLVKVEVTGGRVDPVRMAQAIRPPRAEEFAWVSSLAVRAVSLADLRWLATVLPVGCLRAFQVEVSWTTRSGLMEVLAGCPWFSGLRVLEFSSPYSEQLVDEEAVQLAGLACLNSLCVLRLDSVDLRESGCSALGNSAVLRGLCKLYLRSCSLGTLGSRFPLAALLTPSFGPHLATFSLEHNGLTLPAAETLAAWPALRNVRHLTLDRNPLGDAGLAALLRSPHLGELRELSVQQCELSSRGLQEIARASLPRLEKLNVSSNDSIGDAGLLAICNSTSLPSLQQFLHSRYAVHGLRKQTADALTARFGSVHR